MNKCQKFYCWQWVGLARARLPTRPSKRREQSNLPKSTTLRGNNHFRKKRIFEIAQRNFDETLLYSSVAAFLNIVKMNVGIGVLSMPNAVANAGLGLGAGSMAVLNIMTIHCMLLLASQIIHHNKQLSFVVKNSYFIRSDPHRRYAGGPRYNSWIMLGQSNHFSSQWLLWRDFQNLEGIL